MNHHQANELLPCPFCGGKDIKAYYAGGGSYKSAMCQYCEAEGPAEPTDERAVAAWNRRAAPTTEPADRNAVLEEAARLADAEKAEFTEQAARNNGRDSDFAFGSVNSGERIAAAIRALKLAAPAAPAVPAAPLVASKQDRVMEALTEARSMAMRNAVDARIPECGNFAAIAQNLDWAITTMLSAPPSPSVDQAKRLVGGEVAPGTSECSMCEGAGVIYECVICGASEPRTGTCSGPHDVRSLCAFADRASTGSATSTDTPKCDFCDGAGGWGSGEDADGCTKCNGSGRATSTADGEGATCK